MNKLRWLKLGVFSIIATLALVSSIASNLLFVCALTGISLPLVNETYLEEVVFMLLLSLWCVLFLKQEPNWARIGLIIIMMIIAIRVYRTELFYYSHHIFQFPQIVG
jgi:hypothetical protein